MTLVSASSLEKDVKAELEPLPLKQVAHRVGTMIAARAIEKGITSAVFDRGGYKYHGRIAAVADGAREANLTL